MAHPTSPHTSKSSQPPPTHDNNAASHPSAAPLAYLYNPMMFAAQPPPQPPPPPPPPPNVAPYAKSKTDPRSSTYKSMDNSVDFCHRFMRCMFLLVAIAAFVASYLALVSCAFLEYRIFFSLPPSYATNSPTLSPTISPVPSSSPTTTFEPTTNSTEEEQGLENPNTVETPTDNSKDVPTATFGFYRYTLPYEPDVCYGYDFDDDSLEDSRGTTMRVSRGGAVVATALGASALLLLMIDFFCIRFVCATPLISLTYLAAAISWAFGYGLYASKNCHPNGSSVYLCDLGEGGWFGIVATGLYLLSAFLTCVTPRATPLLRRLKEMERMETTDKCDCFHGCDWSILCFCTHCCRDDKEDDDELVLDPVISPVTSNEDEIKHLIPPHDHHQHRNQVSFMDDDKGGGPGSAAAVDACDMQTRHDIEVNGIYYKQYYDEKAGVTLQNQYTAAYHRWLECEQDYMKMLDRFKEECRELNLNWRRILMKFSTGLRNSPKRNDGQNAFDFEDPYILDEELVRLVSVLQTLKLRCNQSHHDMERIRFDLAAHTPQQYKTTGATSTTATTTESAATSRKRISPETIEESSKEDDDFDDDDNIGSSKLTLASNAGAAEDVGVTSKKKPKRQSTKLRFDDEHDETEVVFEEGSPVSKTTSSAATAFFSATSVNSSKTSQQSRRSSRSNSQSSVDVGNKENDDDPFVLFKDENEEDLFASAHQFDSKFDDELLSPPPPPLPPSGKMQSRQSSERSRSARSGSERSRTDSLHSRD